MSKTIKLENVYNILTTNYIIFSTVLKEFFTFYLETLKHY